MMTARERITMARIVQPLRCLSWVASGCVVLSMISMFGGVLLGEAVEIALVLFAQASAGAGLWLSVRRNSVGPIELIGTSMVIGSIIFTFTMLASLALPLAPSMLGTCAILTTLGLFGLALLMTRSGRGPMLRPATAQELLVIVLTAPLSLIIVSTFWVQTALPREIVGWASLGGDAAVNEAWAKSIAMRGLTDNLLAQGHPLRYHFFGQAWSGFTEIAARAGTYVVTTRIVPLITVAVVLLLTWTWLTMVSGRTAAGWLAIVFLASGGLGVQGSAIYLGSMSQSWGAALVAIFVLTILLSMRGNLAARPLILCMTAGAMVLAKVNAVVLLVAAFGASLAVAGNWRRRFRAMSVLALTCLAALSVILAFEYGYSNGLYASFTQSSNYLGTTIPSGLHLATLLGALLVALVLLTPWSAAVVVAWSKALERKQVLVFSAVLGVTAVILVSFTGQWGQSQFYFAMTAGAVLVPVSAWGCIEAAALLIPTTRRGVLAVEGVAIALASVCLVVGPTPLVLRMLVVVMLAVASAIVVTSSGRSAAGMRARRFTGSLTLVLTASVFLAALLTWLVPSASRWQSADLTRESPDAISDLHIDAIGWLEDANPKHDLVASNWLCSDPAQVPPECLDIAFPVAAVGGQRMLIEGFSYSAGPQPPEWARERLALVQDFSAHPSEETALRLYAAGVRWLFIDRRRTEVESWEPYAQNAFANRDAFVLRLTEPGRQKQGTYSK